MKEPEPTKQLVLPSILTKQQSHDHRKISRFFARIGTTSVTLACCSADNAKKLARTLMITSGAGSTIQSFQPPMVFVSQGQFALHPQPPLPSHPQFALQPQ